MHSTQSSTNETPEQADVRVNKDIAAFSYVWIMSVVIYFSRKDSAFAQYHSKQGMVLFLVSIPISFIPHVGTYLMLPIVAGMLLGFLNAANGQSRDVPIIGPISRGEMSVSDFLHLLVNFMKQMLQGIKKHIIRKKTQVSEAPKNLAVTPASDNVHSGQKLLPSATLP